MNTSVSEILRNARNLLSDRGRWCQLWWARNDLGIPVGSLDKSAARWCLEGAICKVSERSAWRDYTDAFKALERFGVYRDPQTGKPFGPMWINDRLGHDAVIQTLDAAINGLEIEADDAHAEQIGAELIRVLTTESDYPERNVEIRREASCVAY